MDHAGSLSALIPLETNGDIKEHIY
ncbi:Protein of unknown function [Pyronema omphalodes CBS 100304]|uniref:Uncharacterized protein n=1 Tax=Pyronema omphalodes (strain CBS 100304) TaxID=1076935 RepID=U4KZW0_PYROM|nr:Protein of unknown function [Pyronema omphalodes CBS 100304]